MIEDARRLPAGHQVEADVCIIGSGAAGITVARELVNSGKRVVLLVGGGRRESSADRDLNRGSAAPGTTHEPLEENRRRGFGGTTAAWGGRCVPFDPLDFEARPHVPHSGWPLAYDELLPYYRRANEICEAGDFSYDAETALPGSPSELLTGFDSRSVVSNRVERWSPPTHFGRRYGTDLDGAAKTRVLLYAHATHLELSQDGSVIAGIRAATSPLHRFRVVAGQYVLACGGLENPRLLLASNDVERTGIGNRHDNVGRFYMTHLMGVLGTVELARGLDGLVFGFERDQEGVYCRRRIWVTPEEQERCQMANAIALLFRPDINDATHRSALFSSTYLAKSYLNAARKRRPKEMWRALRSDRTARGEHWSVVLRDLPRAVPQALRLFQQRWLVKRRLPSVLGSPTGNQIELFYHTEHAPNPDSRVLLDTTNDELGVPRLRTRVEFSDLDFDTVVRLHSIIDDRLLETGLGRMRYEDDPRRLLQHHVTQFNSQGHHLGTTRMSQRPEEGVVDIDCRVHGVDNLFVAGGSVFPTSSHANPTLTIVALALRLADHLKRPSASPLSERASAGGVHG